MSSKISSFNLKEKSITISMKLKDKNVEVKFSSLIDSNVKSVLKLPTNNYVELSIDRLVHSTLFMI